MFATVTLYIGNRNLSSWSLRPWLLMRQLKIPFDEVMLELDRRETRQRIRAHSPSGKVPVLELEGFPVWDSLAIVETLAELYPARGIWPSEQRARMRARSVVAEMHAGFPDLRKELSMNITARIHKPHLSTAAQLDVDRVQALWKDARDHFGQGGPFLFGNFSAADAFYAPVVTRFVTYGVPVSPESQAYMDTILALDPMMEWIAGARAEVQAAGAEATL
ncbi:MAG: glutathione S-transferase family protein [Myxococcota bacterium]